MRIAVTGKPRLGGVQMRGVSIAEANGWDFVPINKIKSTDQWDAIVLVKYDSERASVLRSATRRLIWDPLDCWEGWGKGKESPYDFWSWAASRVKVSRTIEWGSLSSSSIM